MPLNFESIQNANVKQAPFPYTLIDNVLEPEKTIEIAKSFPNITQGGSFPLESQNIEGEFKKLIEELHQPKLAEIISKKFDINLDNSPVMITLRGFSRKKDGRIHTDSKTKLITMLIYLNEEWDESEGCLRILKDGENLDNYVDEVPPKAGSCLIFKVTENCWHGYKPFEGKRKSIQLNFIVSDTSINKHLKLHGLSAKFKNLKAKFKK
jgi:hypothetical protein